jgi:hypothetical protein
MSAGEKESGMTENGIPAASRYLWEKTVRFACTCPSSVTITATAQESGTSAEALSRKVAAILYMRQTGKIQQEIIDLGQSRVLSAYAKSKKNGHTEKQRFIRWRLPCSLADAIQANETSEDQEECLQARLMRVLGVRTSIELWEFFLSNYADLSDEEIRNLGSGQVKVKGKAFNAD